MRFALLLIASAALSACALTRGPITPAERLARTQQRLDAAVTPEARASVAEALFAEVRLSPISGTRRAFGTVAAGIVPGRRPGLRDTLVIVAAALDGPHAATLVEAARAVAERANTRGDLPERSVLLALWPAGLTPEEGVAAVRDGPSRLPWPTGTIRLTLILGSGLADPTGPPTSPILGFEANGLSERLTVDALTNAILAAATRPGFVR